MSDATARAYEAFAPIYDEFNEVNDYEMWLGRTLLPELERHGLRRGRVLDVGCGTGMAFEPMLKRDWEIVACDLTPGMLAEARRKFGDAVTLRVADAAALPVFGEFELVWALNDVVNYLTGDQDLQRALAGMRSNLAPGGLVLFDANTMMAFEGSFASGYDEKMSRGRWHWEGQTEEIAEGAVFAARLSGEGVEPHVHRERHWTAAQVATALDAAGLELVAHLGMQDEPGGVVLVDPPDERKHPKVIYIGRGRD